MLDKKYIPNLLCKKTPKEVYMNLRVYLAEKNLTMTKFAQMVDAVPQYISSICCGRAIPGRKLATKIEELTEGAVVFSEWKEKMLQKRKDKYQGEHTKQCECGRSICFF